MVAEGGSRKGKPPINADGHGFVFSRVTSAENKGSIDISAVFTESPPGFGSFVDVVPDDRAEADDAQDDEEGV